MMQRRYILEQWNSFSRAVFTPDTSDVQREEMKKAFFAGAQALFSVVLNMLDPGMEPTAKDLANMDAIHRELDDYVKQFRIKNGIVQ